MKQSLVRRVMTGCCLTLLTAAGASAQVLGTFSWQMQPYCNIVTLTLTQTPGGFTADGSDNQCGAAKLAGAAGMALFNPDGTVGLEFTIVTAPSGKAVHVSASVNPGNGSGSWTDSVGNSGTMALGAPGSGSPRPLPASGLGAAVITSAEIAPNAVGVSNINAAQVQTRITGSCPAGQTVSGVNQNGSVTCAAPPVELLAAFVASNGALTRGSGATNALSLGTGLYEVGFNRDVTQCYYSANSFDASSRVVQQLQPRSGNPNGVFLSLKTTDGANTLVNGSFYLTVFCPRP